MAKARTWYVVRSNVKCEEKAAMNLRRAGYRVYLPKMRKDIVHHRTKKRVTRHFVLFNRYMFVGVPRDDPRWYVLRSCEGVECVLGEDGPEGRRYPPQLLTRAAHTTWTLAAFVIDDGPYDADNTQGTNLTPADYGSVTPVMTGLTTPSGTVTSATGHADAWKLFNKEKGDAIQFAGRSGWVAYDLAGAATAAADAYWITNDEIFPLAVPATWQFQGWDGANWITLDTRSGETGWGGGETRYYEFVNETAYQSYRLIWTATAGTDSNTRFSEIGIHQRAQTQTAFNLTASSVTGINDGVGFKTTDVGRAVRLRGSDGRYRWARIIARTNATVVTIQLYDHALPDLSPISRWQLGTFVPGMQPEAVQVFEERLALSRRFSAFLSKSFEFDDFGVGEADDDAMEFLNAGGGQANDIVWLADADGSLLIATTGGIRALSGSGIDEALTPSSFKNRRSRTFGCARIAPVDAGSSFLYVTRSRKALAELLLNQSGRFTSDDVGQISEHIPKKGIVEIAFQTDPDPILWFPVLTGELGGYTHQPSQEVRGMHRHRIGGTFAGSAWGIVERSITTPGQDGIDDVWLIVKRTINGVTKRYIETMEAPFEYGALEDAFQVDCGLTYEGAAVGTLTGLSHLLGETVDVLANGKVYKGLTVAAGGTGSVTLPNGETTTKAHVGLPTSSDADTLELDVGGKDGSRIGRRKKVSRVIMSLLETDTTGLEVSSLIRGKWEQVRIPTNVPADGKANLFTGNIDVPIDDSWEGQGQVRIRHTNPTPCTIRALTPAFDAEP